MTSSLRVLRALACAAILLAACSSASPSPSAPAQSAGPTPGLSTAPGTGGGSQGTEPPGGGTATNAPGTGAPETSGPGETTGPGETSDPGETSAPSEPPPTEAPPTQRPDSPAIRPVKLDLVKVADGFDQPNDIVSAGDDRLFVAEQVGNVIVLKPNGDGTYHRAGTFLDISSRVVCCGEKGFLGITFPPDYKTSGKFYITFAGTGHTWNLEERRVSADDPDKADPDWQRKLIRIYKPHDFHWGGDLAFGPDGYLWVSVGDGGFSGVPGPTTGDPDNRSQDLSQIWGKMLRIDPNDPDGRHGERYGIPPDNPFVDKPDAAPEVWARGLRNPWRWSFDRLTGDLWIADVGHDTWEEIDRALAPGRGKGANYGWRRMEGPDCYIPQTGCDTGDLKKPIAWYRHGSTGDGYRCATTGGYVYRGKDYPAMRSRFIFGDYCSGTLFSLDANGPNHQEPDRMLDTNFTISTLGEDNKGELYVAEYTPDGAIYRITGKPPGG